MFTIRRQRGNIELKLPSPSYYIYKITNTENGKVYIGSTNNVERRIEEHLTGKGSIPLLNDLVEYGRTAFTFEVIDMLATSNKQTVFELEDSYIEKFDCLTSGYNLRLNREPRSDEQVNLTHFTVQAKYQYGNNFTIGMNSLYLSYQRLLSVYKKISGGTPCITLKSRGGHPYIWLQVRGVDSVFYTEGKTYTLNLKYEDNLLTLLFPSVVSQETACSSSQSP